MKKIVTVCLWCFGLAFGWFLLAHYSLYYPSDETKSDPSPNVADQERPSPVDHSSAALSTPSDPSDATNENDEFVPLRVSDGNLFVEDEKGKEWEFASVAKMDAKIADRIKVKRSGEWIEDLIPIIGIAAIALIFLKSRWAQLPAMKNIQAQANGMGKVPFVEAEHPKVTFADVAGVDEVLVELREIAQFLEYPERYEKLGARIPKGVLLTGPPGTGKTLLARALAGEAKVPFFHLSASALVEIYSGVGAARVRDLFQKARAKTPSIIFIDEIDAVGRERSGNDAWAHQEREQTLNELLTNMDGFDSDDGVIVLAATNRPDVLDTALLRPGRFDRRISVDLPDVRGREAILRLHAKEITCAPDVDFAKIASLTSGFSGAQLESLLNEAALRAAREGKDAIGQEGIHSAIERVAFGLARSLSLSEADRDIIAYHEAGHAIAAAAAGGGPVSKVSIVARSGGIGGFTLVNPEEDRLLITEPQAAARLVTFLGGYAAERVAFGFVSNGAANDLKCATDFSALMIAQWGMSEEFGLLYLRGVYDRSDRADQRLEEVQQKMLTFAVEEATKIFTEHRTALDRLANALKERETLTGDELQAYLPAPVARRSVAIS